MIELKNLSVSYDGKRMAIKDINLHIDQGDIVGIIGASGSGKSTLLKSINRLVEPQEGSQVFVHGQEVTGLGPRELRRLRRKIGMVFQDYNLVGRSSVLDNVLIGRLGYKSRLDSFLGRFSSEEYELAARSLTRLGLEDKIFVRADQLSGGQKQRVAISKALVQKPLIILADEPVSSLDQASSRLIMDYFKKVNEKKGITLLINLHDVELAKKYCSRILGLHQGQLIFDGGAGDLNDRILEELYD